MLHWRLVSWPRRFPDEFPDELGIEPATLLERVIHGNRSISSIMHTSYARRQRSRQLARRASGSGSSGLRFKGFTVKGELVSGDLKPLSLIPFLKFMENFIVIRASYDSPLSLEMTINPASPSPRFIFNAMLTFNPPRFLGMGEINLPIEVEGTLGSDGPKAVFKTPAIPPLDLGFFKFGGLGVYIATANSVSFTLDSGTRITLDRGFALMYEGASPIKAFCPTRLVLKFIFKSFISFYFEGACVGFSLKLFHKPPIMIPSINFINFMSIKLFAGISPSLIELGIGTSFQLATGTSYCADPLEAECMEISFEVALGVTPTHIVIGMALPTSGIWIEPLGLRNFAVINPSLEFEIQILQAFPHAPTPRKIAWAITILYKMPGMQEWPDFLRYRDEPFPAPYRPNLEPYVRGDLRQMSSFFLYEQWHTEIDDLLCSITGLPRFAMKIVVPRISLTQLMFMMSDIVLSMVSAASPQEVHTPPAVANLIEGIDQLLSIEMSLYFELSLIQADPVPEWQEPVMRGIYLNMTANAYFVGFIMDFRLEAQFQIPTPSPSQIAQAASFLATFFTNPAGVLTGKVAVPDLGIRAGFLIEAYTNIPFIGEAYFYGRIAFLEFELRAWADMEAGPFRLDLDLRFTLNTRRGVDLLFTSTVEAGPLGAIDLYGEVRTVPVPSYNLNGTICANLIGLQVRGNFLTCAGALCPVDFYTGFELWARVGFMGEIMLAGSFLANGNDVAIKAKARLEIDFEKVHEASLPPSSPSPSLAGQLFLSMYIFVILLCLAYDSCAF